MQIQHILVIDDDTRIRSLLKKFLVDQGFYVTTAADAAEARRKLKEYQFHLLIVDVMMPGETGVELTKSLHKKIETPVLMLTAMGDVEDRITGLESGADDYLPKPFEPRELLLRIQKLLKRTQYQKQQAQHIAFGPYQFNTQSLTLKKKNTVVTLTTTESQLLAIFSQHLGEAVSREQIVNETTGISERSVDVQIKRLRQKIEENPKQPHFLRTVRGKGYIFHND